MSDNAATTYELALGVLANTPTILESVLAPLPEDVWTWSPVPGEWSPRAVIAHMLHVETAVIPVRVRQMIATDGAPLASAADAAEPGSREDTLSAWRTAREQNLIFLRTLTPAQLDHGGEHPLYGRISAREHIVEWAYHDLDHVRQLQAIVEARLYPDIGGFRALYPLPFPAGDHAN